MAERGGGIDSSGPLIVDGSLLSNNTASTNEGGGINMSGGQITVTNSTLYGNTADGDGGGIYASASVTMTINNSTLSGNSASSGGGIGAAGTNGNLQLLNTIIANSTGGDCSAASGKFGANVNNLIDDGSCSATFSGDPNLSALQDNGGQTLTLLPLTGSTAIDNG